MNTGFPSWPESADPTPRPTPRWRWALVLLLLVAAGSGFAWWQFARASGDPSAPTPSSTVSTSDAEARPPEGARVVVRVVNASGVRGLARRATLMLRDFGYDVVDYDSQRNPDRTSTQILVHTGQTEWAERLQRALGLGTITPSADSSRYVDLTVVLGRDWQPPTEPLRP